MDKAFTTRLFCNGSNKFDNKFLSTECKYQTSFGDVKLDTAERRQLLARAPQTKSVNRTDEYMCNYTTARLSHMIIDKRRADEDGRLHSFRSEEHSLKVLYVGNCTGNTLV